MTSKRVSTLQARAALLGLALTESQSGFALTTQNRICVLKTRALSRIGAELARREVAKLQGVQL